MEPGEERKKVENHVITIISQYHYHITRRLINMNENIFGYLENNIYSSVFEC